MNTKMMHCVKLTKESLPALTDSVKNGGAKSIRISSPFKNEAPSLFWESTLNAQSYKDNAVKKLEKTVNLPEHCGEVFVTLA